AVLADGDRIGVAHLSPRVAGATASGRRAGEVGRAGDGEQLADVLARVEKQVILDALAKSAGKKSQAARALGLSRPGLDAKIERHGIDVGTIRSEAKKRRGES
ncbi:MAG: hypothetical protein KC635_17225, partial [Myxococcales bacterium]|nr:hypothetical protein [Myxococcales bacterium]